VDNNHRLTRAICLDSHRHNNIISRYKPL
jgi:hypothetical protein